MKLQPIAAEHGAQIVFLGHGSTSDARRFHRHFPLENLYVSEDMLAFRALQLHRGSILDFIGPQAFLTAIPTAAKSLMNPGTLAAKREQPLPGEGDFRQMGGQFLFEPGDVCKFQHREQTPGDHVSIPILLRGVGWN